MAIDPVCGMSVEESLNSNPVTHEHTTYYFCSWFCRRAFEMDPERFVSSIKPCVTTKESEGETHRA